MDTPAVGKMVQYVNYRGELVPAVIRVVSKDQGAMTGLIVFDSPHNLSLEADYHALGTVCGTWRFPE